MTEREPLPLQWLHFSTDPVRDKYGHQSAGRPLHAVRALPSETFVQIRYRESLCGRWPEHGWTLDVVERAANRSARAVQAVTGWSPSRDGFGGGEMGQPRRVKQPEGVLGTASARECMEYADALRLIARAHKAAGVTLPPRLARKVEQAIERLTTEAVRETDLGVLTKRCPDCAEQEAYCTCPDGPNA